MIVTSEVFIYGRKIGDRAYEVVIPFELLPYLNKNDNGYIVYVGEEYKNEN